MYLTLGGNRLTLGSRNLILGAVTVGPTQGGGMRPPIWPMQMPFPDDQRAASLIRQNNAALVALLI